MSLLDTSRLSLPDARRLFESWRDRMHEQSEAFAIDVWGRRDDERQRSWTDIDDAFHFLNENLHLVEETPNGALPLWITPGVFLNKPWPNSPDLASAWLLDKFGSWSASLALELRSDCDFYLYRSKRRPKEDAHHGWMLGDGQTFGYTIQTMLRWATEFSWPSDATKTTLQSAARRHRVFLQGPEAKSAARSGKEELLTVEIQWLEDGAFAVSVPLLSVIRGRLESEVRQKVESALKESRNVIAFDWEDREVIHVRGSLGAADLRATCSAVLSTYRPLLADLD